MLLVYLHESNQICFVDDDSKVLWTNFDEGKGFAHILWMHANPEVIKGETDSNGVFNVSVLLLSNTSFAEYYAITGDYKRNLLFYTDYM